MLRLKTDFSINGKALGWFLSYLEDTSVLGPKEFTLYTKPIGGIIREHGLKYHLYADDSQNYFAFEALDNAEVDEMLRRVEKCVADMRNWLEANILKVNEEKTVVMLFTAKHRGLKHVSINVGAFDIRSVPIVRNLDALFDQHMIMDLQVHAVCTSAYYHLRYISRIRLYLTEPATQILVHSLVTTRLDYCTCNSLLYGVPRRILAKLQLVQNAAACLVSRSCHRQHITPVLRQLHYIGFLWSTV